MSTSFFSGAVVRRFLYANSAARKRLDTRCWVTDVFLPKAGGQDDEPRQSTPSS